MRLLKNNFDAGNTGTEGKFIKRIEKTYEFASESEKNKLLIGGAVHAFLRLPPAEPAADASRPKGEVLHQGGRSFKTVKGEKS